MYTLAWECDLTGFYVIQAQQSGLWDVTAQEKRSADEIHHSAICCRLCTWGGLPRNKRQQECMTEQLFVYVDLKLYSTTAEASMTMMACPNGH